MVIRELLQTVLQCWIGLIVQPYKSLYVKGIPSKYYQGILNTTTTLIMPS